MATALRHYRLQRPAGDHPPSLVIVRRGRRYELAWGTVFRASATCDPAGRVANLDHNPPLIHTSIVERMSESFEALDTDTETTETTEATP